MAPSLSSHLAGTQGAFSDRRRSPPIARGQLDNEKKREVEKQKLEKTKKKKLEEEEKNESSLGNGAKAALLQSA